MKKDRFTVTLLVAIGLLFIWQLLYMIAFVVTTKHVIPYEVSLLFLTWQQTDDVFLSVPNFFLVPVVILLGYLGVKRSKSRN